MSAPYFTEAKSFSWTKASRYSVVWKVWIRKSMKRETWNVLLAYPFSMLTTYFYRHHEICKCVEMKNSIHFFQDMIWMIIFILFLKKSPTYQGWISNIMIPM